MAEGSLRGRTTGSDFMLALVVCEELLDGSERRTRWLHASRVGQLSAALLGLGAACVLLGGQRPGGWLGGLAVVLAAGFAIGVPVVAQILLAAPLHEQIVRDRTIMVDTVNVLRELLPMIVEAERWGITQQRFVQSRIQRFPIGQR